ncbi:hypothetical protein KKD52_09765, partial [Myxococcota bacterium]|nr:hypothetical protein [Myxococcota bacterium]
MMFLRRTVMPLLSLIILVCACDTPVEVKQSCGDGFIDPGEECDGDNLATRNCEQLGYYSGTGPIVCNGECMMDLSPCGGRCGDGQIQTQYGEECDGAELGEGTCVDQGMGSGVLACSTQCRFDLSGCAAAAVCGDGLIATPAEECEPGDLQDQTCFTLGYYGGNLACGGDCRFDLASCQSAGRCGDGTLHADFGEICDGYSLGGVTCEELNYHGGTLACATDCTFDLASCVAAGRCGDGVLQDDTGEQCDLDDLGPQTCEDLYPGYGGGALACADDCTLDPAGCARCGDGLLQTSQGELCDGDALDGATCETQGQYPGTLACAADCAELVLDGCGGSCGDGVVQEAFLEDCETGLPVNTSCALQGLGLGALGCTSACAYDTAACLRASATGGGASSSCALLEDGTVRCWGRNDQGTLGDGTTSTRTLPVAVSGLS